MTRYLFVVLLFCVQPLYAVTLVYNLRVRRTFSAPQVLEHLKKPRTIFSLVPIYFSRASHITEERTMLDTCETRRAGGSLLNMRYVPSKYWWLEVTTGIETDQAQYKGTDTFNASRSGFDDIVGSGGYRFFFGKHCQVVGYGLVGLPTTRKITRCDRLGPLLGTRVYNLGFGFEGSYSFIDEIKTSLSCIAQYRLIHGFNRDWFPILPEGSTIQPGNVSDVLLTIQYRKRRTLVEGGYNATIFTNQAAIVPTLGKIKTDPFVRNGGYISISHGWFKAFFDKPFICGVGCNFNHTKRFDAKTTTVWAYGAIVF